MILSSRITDVEFLLSKDELTYGKVLDDFTNAKKIYILTYNISKKNDELLKALKDCGESTEIKIISNIPSRWNEYFSENYANLAKRNIAIYKNKLNPQQIAEKAEVYFCFANHAKIIMTDNIVYVGSSNFSEESAENIESGFISRDKNFIEFLEDEVFPWVIGYSSDYNIDNELLFLQAAIQQSIAMFDSIYESYHMKFYFLADHRGQEQWYYNVNEDNISLNDIDKTVELFDNYLELLEHINRIFGLNVVIDEGVDDITDLIDYANQVINNIKEIFSEKLYDLARFNKQDFIDDYMNENLMEAYDEYLDDYMDKSMDAANDAFEELAEGLKDDVDELLEELKYMKDISKNVLKRFNEVPKKLIQIDNTKFK